MMNRILFFAAFLSIALFSNCKKDKTAEDLIQGKWNVTKLIADGENIIEGDPEFRTEVELEFLSSGSVIFNITEIDSSVSPAEEFTFALAGSYSISDDDKLTISVNDGTEILTASGNLDITSSRMVFTATSAGSEEFIEILEADKQ